MEPVTTPQNINRLWSMILVDQLVKNGADTFYCCPGMRNAPLLWAISQHPGARAITGVDERAHAFRALGAAKETGKTSLLVCTSGTALTNFSPAVAEAHKSHTPLMVISADRPPELNWTDHNQTLPQDHAYDSWLRAKKNWGTPSQDVPLHALASMASNLFIKGQYPLSGPVHLNCCFRDPLDGCQQELASELLHEYQTLLKEAHPRGKFPKIESYIEPKSFAAMRSLLISKTHDPSKVLVVIGETSPWDDNEEIKKFCQNSPWPLFTDVTSGVKYSFPLEKGGVPTFDHPEVFRYFDEHPPEVVLHLGRRMVSKHYYRWLMKNPDVHLIQVTKHADHIDPSFQVNESVPMTPEDFCRQLNNEELFSSKETLFWKDFVHKKSKAIEDYESESGGANRKGMTFPELSKSIVENTLNNARLYIGNSTAIRSFDSFASISHEKNYKVLSHRGASGIEGFLSAAIGAYETNPKTPLTLVLGDLSLMHDFNALITLGQGLQSYDAPFVIIVANNYQGGIFNLLPIGKEQEINSMLCTPHNFSFASLTEVMGIKTTQVKNKETFKHCYQSALESNFVSFIEVIIDDEENQKLYSKLKTIRL